MLYLIFVITMAAKNNITDKQYLAKILYTREKLEQVVIAKKVGVSANTISKWVNEFNWKALRKRLLLSKEEQVNQLYEELEEISEKIKKKPVGDRYADTKIADIRVKTTASIRNLESDLGIAEIVDVGYVALKQAQKTESLEQVMWFTDFWYSFIQSQMKR